MAEETRDLLESLLRLGTDGMVDHAHSALLSDLLRRSAFAQQALWCAAVLKTCSPCPVRLKPLEEAVLGILLMDPLGPLQGFEVVGGVGHVITAKYERRPMHANPAVTVVPRFFEYANIYPFSGRIPDGINLVMHRPDLFWLPSPEAWDRVGGKQRSQGENENSSSSDLTVQEWRMP